MNYFIGIDGGGTKTRCVLTDSNLKIISQIEGSSSNPHVIGFDKSAQLIQMKCRLLK